MSTVASKVPFYELASLLDKINAFSKKGPLKNKLLKDFVDKWRAFHNKLHATDGDVTDSFFPCMRLLLPHLDRDREAYGIKEHTLAKLYIEVLGMGKDSDDAQKLLHYRAPKNAKVDAGDFASVAYLVLKDRCPDKGTLMIQEVNDRLDEIATGNAAKNKDAVRRSLLHMLKNMSAREQKWLVRIIMKELKMGLSQDTVFKLYHEDAKDLYNVKMSLDKVCSMLKDPQVRLHEIEVSLFSPFRPMLGAQATPNKIENLMQKKSFFVETKFDGERMQLHKRDNSYKYFSRGGNDYTHTYGANQHEGNLTPYIFDCFKAGVQSCVLDGEMVGYNAENKTIGSKGENFDIKSRDAGVYQPMLCVFDVLLYNGVVLANKPLRERRTILEKILTPVDGRVMISEYTEKRTKQECSDALNDAIDRREEGIMAKDPDSPYKPNTRTGGWYKLKPEYIGGLSDELDVLVVGGSFGVGSRSHMMSHFLCAVAIKPGGDGHPTSFWSFCRVGSGYTRKELFDFNRKLADHWVPFDRKNPPLWLELAPGLKQRPDAYIEPKNSTILQIKATEIIESEQFRTGYTLRFPRVEKIRTDKPWYNCMTTGELEELRQKSSGKLTGRHNDPDADDGESPKKKRGRVQVRTVKPTVMAQFCGVDASSVKKLSDTFAGKEFCVVNGPAELSKSDMERKIIELGGSIVQNPGNETYCVLVDKLTIKAQNIVRKGANDVVKVQWFLRCLEQQSLLKWSPSDMIHASPKTAAEFALDYDRHGDSYYDDTNSDALRAVFDRIPPELAEPVNSETIAELEMKYFPHESPYGIFRLCRVYMDDCLEVGEPASRVSPSSLHLLSAKLRLYGATISDDLSHDVSHVVVHSSDVSRLKCLRQVNKRRAKKFHIVSENWVNDSIDKGKMLEERPYEPE